MLVHPYQTLVREIATPTIPDFAKACLHILKTSATDFSSTIPLTVVETICDSFSALIPLYPATFRPFSNQSHTAVKSYLAPTISDGIYVPSSLRQAARRLVIRQHHVAAKSGGSDEWMKHLNSIFTEFHATADQVLRAIDESWESSSGNARSIVVLEDEPCGGDSFPSWTGIQAGSERMIGLFQYLSDCLRCSTKGIVTVPLTKFTDAISRVCLVARLSPRSQTWDQALQTRAAIGREEKEDLWSTLSDIHIAALQVAQTMFQRLGKDMLPFASEVIDHVVRIFNSGISIPTVRFASYLTLNSVLLLAGPTLSKPMVDMLGSVIGACCRDLQEDAGFLKKPSKTATATGDTKKNNLAANADLFLQQPKGPEEGQTFPLEPEHKAAACSLLAVFLTNLPQKHLKPSLRGIIDQTAVLTRNRDAMFSSALNPYIDSRGRRYASILPHLTQQFPQDQGLEILRTNLRTDVSGASGAELASFDGVETSEDEYPDEEMAETKENEVVEAKATESAALPVAPKVEVELTIQNNPFGPRTTETTGVYSGFGNVQRAGSPPKRKHDGSSPLPPKRQELEKLSESAPMPLADNVDNNEDDHDDEDDDESVHLNMELEDDDDEEDEE